MFKTYCLLFSLTILNISIYAQDKIYYKQNKTDDWQVTEVNPDLIKGTDSKNPQIAYSTPHTNVLFIFNSLGNFLVVPKLFERSVPDMYIKSFFKRVNNRFNEFDKIITVENHIIVCKYEKENGKKIEYTVANKLNQVAKSEVAVIIFKNGEHKLLTSVEKAFKVLSETQDQYTELAVSTKTEPDIKVSRNDSLLVNKLLQDREDSTRKANSSIAKNVKDSLVKPPVPVKTDITKGNANTEKKLDSATLLKLQDKAIVNIHLLEDYIKSIVSKTAESDQVDKTIERALTLFANEDAKVEVSSLNNKNLKSYRIRVYLNNLGELKYDKVDIEWYNVQYTSQLRKGADGNYYGVIEFEQRFTGITEDKRVYQDITRKTVEIVLKTYKRSVGGESTLEWDVFLGNIGIAETKPA